jgi:hypothetical protein
MYTMMTVVPDPGLRKYWRQNLSSLKFQCHDITNKNPEVASIVQAYEVPSDIEILARYTPAKVGERSEWTTIVKSANFCKILDRKPLYGALYGMYTVTLNELKAVLKVSA